MGEKGGERELWNTERCQSDRHSKKQRWKRRKTQDCKKDAKEKKGLSFPPSQISLWNPQQKTKKGGNGFLRSMTSGTAHDVFFFLTPLTDLLKSVFPCSQRANGTIFERKGSGNCHLSSHVMTWCLCIWTAWDGLCKEPPTLVSQICTQSAHGPLIHLFHLHLSACCVWRKI